MYSRAKERLVHSSKGIRDISVLFGCRSALKYALHKIPCLAAVLCPETHVAWKVIRTCAERRVTHCRASFRSLNLIQNIYVGVAAFVFRVAKIVNQPQCKIIVGVPSRAEPDIHPNTWHVAIS